MKYLTELDHINKQNNEYKLIIYYKNSLVSNSIE